MTLTFDLSHCVSSQYVLDRPEFDCELKTYDTGPSQNGCGQRPRAEYLNFKPPSVNLERVKLETLNSVH